MLPHGEMCFSEEGILTKDERGELRQRYTGHARRRKEIEKAPPASCLCVSVFSDAGRSSWGIRCGKGNTYLLSLKLHKDDHNQ